MNDKNEFIKPESPNPSQKEKENSKDISTNEEKLVDNDENNKTDEKGMDICCNKCQICRKKIPKI